MAKEGIQKVVENERRITLLSLKSNIVQISTR
jgi:hypothetical protein